MRVASPQAYTAFRYIGAQGRKATLANAAGFDPSEPRILAGQPCGGQWTAGGGGIPRSELARLHKTPSALGLSGQNGWKPPLQPQDSAFADYLSGVGEVWKGYGDAISDMVVGIWNTFRHPIVTGEGVVAGVKQIALDPAATLKAIGQKIAEDFTSGDPRKAGKLVAQVLLSVEGPEEAPEELAVLLPKVEAAAAGEKVSFSVSETAVIDRALVEDAGRGGIGPVNKGKIGVKQSEAESLAAGEKIAGREITFELPSQSRTRSDLLTETEKGLKVREAKNGPKAVLSAAQKEMKQTIEKGGTVIPRGANAKAAGLTPGDPVMIMQHEVDHF